MGLRFLGLGPSRGEGFCGFGVFGGLLQLWGVGLGCRGSLRVRIRMIGSLVPVLFVSKPRRTEGIESQTSVLNRLNLNPPKP